MTSRSPPSSPYAGGPNTPIASSKRARVAKKGNEHIFYKLILKKKPNYNKNIDSIASPVRNSTRTMFSNADQSKGDNNMNNKNSIPQKAVLFSPALTHAAKLEQQQQQQQQVNTTPKQDDEIDDDEDVFNPYQFIGSLSPYTDEERKVWLPPLSASSKVQTLTLDLDETLVHCSIEPVAKYDWSFPVSFNGTDYQVYVKKRPYLDYFLEIVSKSFEVIVFTASQKVYADVLLDLLDPEKKYIGHRLFREACVPVQGNYIKDLKVLGRDLNKTVLVDNSPHAYGFQIDNGIPIESWFDDDNDTELLKLVGFLRQLTNVDDVRPIVHDHFKTYQLVANAKRGIPVSLSAPPF